MTLVTYIWWCYLVVWSSLSTWGTGSANWATGAPQCILVWKCVIRFLCKILIWEVSGHYYLLALYLHVKSVKEHDSVPAILKPDCQPAQVFLTNSLNQSCSLAFFQVTNDHCEGICSLKVCQNCHSTAVQIIQLCKMQRKALLSTNTQQTVGLRLRYKLKSIWLRRPHSFSLQGQPHNLENSSAHRLEMSIPRMPSSITGPVLEPFNHWCTKSELDQLHFMMPHSPHLQIF